VLENFWSISDGPNYSQNEFAARICPSSKKRYRERCRRKGILMCYTAKVALVFKPIHFMYPYGSLFAVLGDIILQGFAHRWKLHSPTLDMVYVAIPQCPLVRVWKKHSRIEANIWVLLISTRTSSHQIWTRNDGRKDIHDESISRSCN
jgi:hypothetical protein